MVMPQTCTVLHPCVLRREGSRDQGGAEQAPERSAGVDDGCGGEVLVCRRCGLHITSGKQRISVNGSHEHTFVNPEGISFCIGCFGYVQGCLFRGEPSEQWSWFKGYCWRITYCAGCGLHLGWCYSSADDVFHGLVLRSLSSVV
jgi:hypothetical protein